MNDNKTNTRKRINVALVVLGLLIACTVGVTIYSAVAKRSQSTEIEVNKEKEQEVVTENDSDLHTVSNEEQLRELLNSESELEIHLTDDIIVSDTLQVKGVKTLKGSGTIEMVLSIDMEPYSTLISVAEGATLNVDGVTIDGKCYAECVRVEMGATLNLISGNIIHGGPYCINNRGNIYMTGGTVADSVHTGVYINSGEMLMEGGTVSGHSSIGIAVGYGTYLKVTGNAVLEKSQGLIYNYGTLDIHGGVLRDCYGRAVDSRGGNVNVAYQGNDQDGMLEWSNVGFAVDVRNAAVANVTGLSVSNCRQRAFAAQGGGEITVKNTKVDTTGIAAVWTSDGKLNLEDVTIDESGSHGIYVASDGVVNAKNVTVTSSKERGIMVTNNSKFSGTNVAIEDSGMNSFTVSNKSTATVNGLKIKNAEKTGITITTSTLTGNNITVKSTKEEGIVVADAKAKATLENVTIQSADSCGVRVNRGQLQCKTLNVKDTGKHSLAAYHGGVATVSDFKFTDCGQKSGHGIYAYAAGSTVKASNGTITNTVNAAVNAENEAVLELTDVELNGKMSYGVQVKSGSQATLNAFTATGTKNTTIAVYASSDENKVTKVQGEGITIGSSNSNGIMLAKDEKNEDSDVQQVEANLKTVAISKTKGIGAHVKCGTLTLNGASVKENTGHGVVVEAGAILSTENTLVLDKLSDYGMKVEGTADLDIVQLNNAMKNIAIVVQNHGKLTASDMTLTNVKSGIYLKNNHEETFITQLNISDVTTRGLVVDEGGYATILNLDIKTIGERGIDVLNGGHLTIKTSGTIDDVPESYGVCVDGAATLNNVTVSNVKKNAAIRVLANGNLTADTLTAIEGNNIGLQIDAKAETNEAEVQANIIGLNVQNTTDKGIYVKANGTATITNLTVASTTGRGVDVEAGGTLTVTTGTIDNVPTSYGVCVDGTATLNNVTVSNVANNAAIRVFKNGNLTADTLTMITGNKSGLQIDAKAASNNAEVQANITGLNVKNTISYGVNVDAGGSATIGNLEVSNTGAHGVNVAANGQLTVNSGTIQNISGIYNNENNCGVNVAGKVTLNNVTIQDVTNNYAIRVAANGALNSDGLTLSGTNSGGINVVGSADTKNAKATLNNLTLDATFKSGHGVRAENAEVTITKITKTDNTTYASNFYNLINVRNSATFNVTDADTTIQGGINGDINIKYKE